MPLQAVVNVERPFCFLEPGAPNKVLGVAAEQDRKRKGNLVTGIELIHLFSNSQNKLLVIRRYL